jgi:hypothetical protein
MLPCRAKAPLATAEFHRPFVDRGPLAQQKAARGRGQRR